jgi:hypothetical protein
MKFLNSERKDLVNIVDAEFFELINCQVDRNSLPSKTSLDNCKYLKMINSPQCVKSIKVDSLVKI